MARWVSREPTCLCLALLLNVITATWDRRIKTAAALHGGAAFAQVREPSLKLGGGGGREL